MVSFGGVPERSKGSDCKSDGTAFEGSNPSPSTKLGGCKDAGMAESVSIMSNVWRVIANSAVS